MAHKHPTTEEAWPAVSVIMPVRDEEGYVAACLRSLLRGDYPPKRWEIIIADGMSEDGTRVAIARVAQTSPVPITVVDNPRGLIPTALNLAIARARGEIIVRVDAHAEYPPHYLTQCGQALREHGADNVGGPVTTEPGAGTLMARAIAALMSHPFGVGNSAFRTSRRARKVDTVPFGCFPRDVFARVGLFDERLHRHEDFTFNQRLRAAGGTVYLDPRLTSVYLSRATLRGLLRQAWDNGCWNALAHHLHPASRCARHALPGVFALGVLFALLMAVAFALGPLAMWLFIPAAAAWAACAAYAAVNLLVATGLALRRGVLLWPYLLGFFPLFHFTYGAGILWGWARVLLHSYPWEAADGIPTLEEMHRPTRRLAA